MHDYDLIAPFYDIEHDRFSEDLDMYRNYAELGGGKILELACGSGRVLLPLAQEGYELTGVDSSEKMLQIAQQRLQEKHLESHCQLVKQDMRTLQLLSVPSSGSRKGIDSHSFPTVYPQNPNESSGNTLEQKYRLAIIALGSFGHITTRKDQQSTLAAIRAHLSPGATLILDISNSDARYMENLSGQVLHQGTWSMPDGYYATHFVSPTASTEKHLLELTHFYDRHQQGGLVERTVITTQLYLFDRTELELLLERAGFVMKDVYGDYDLGPFELESPRMIFIAEAH